MAARASSEKGTAAAQASGERGVGAARASSEQGTAAAQASGEQDAGPARASSEPWREQQEQQPWRE